jgi:hypothetical protein
MSMIVPWTTPNGERCCCNPCEEEQPSQYSAVTLTSSAFDALYSDAGGTGLLEFTASINIGIDGSLGARSTMSGSISGTFPTIINQGGCAVNGTQGSFTPSNSVSCGYTIPTHPERTYTLSSSSCLAFVGGVGPLGWRLTQNNVAYITTGVSIAGVVQHVFTSAIDTITTGAVFQLAILTQSAGTNGTIVLSVGGELFNLPVIYSLILDPTGTLNPNNVSWTYGPAQIFNPSAP